MLRAETMPGKGWKRALGSCHMGGRKMVVNFVALKLPYFRIPGALDMAISEGLL